MGEPYYAGVICVSIVPLCEVISFLRGGMNFDNVLKLTICTSPSHSTMRCLVVDI